MELIWPAIVILMPILGFVFSVFLIEAKLADWKLRGILNLILISVLSVFLAKNFTEIGRAVLLNRFAYVMPQILMQIRQSSEDVRNERLERLAKQMGEPQNWENIEGIANELSSEDYYSPTVPALPPR